MNDASARVATEAESGILWAYRFEEGQKPQVLSHFDVDMVDPNDPA